MPCMIPRGAALFTMAVFLWGCGTANNDAPSFDAASGKHPAGWVSAVGGNHRLAFRADSEPCKQCHGSDLLVAGSVGGVARVSCSSTSFDGIICHANGHLPRLAPHVLPFTNPALHGTAAKTDLVFCQGCHAFPTASGPGSNPRFNVKIGALVNGCEDCHNIFTAHPSSPFPDSAPWRGTITHRDAGNLANACVLCHGAAPALAGGIGPACSTCHATSPLTNLNCTSCHGSAQANATPGLPAGGVFPNISGAHNEHNVFNNVAGVCSTCHDGAGIGTINHFNNKVVNVAVLAAYNAKTGGFAKYSSAGLLVDSANNGGQCKNISCHGGITTPSWRTGIIDVDTQCTSCHRSRTASDQFNSYFSGNPVVGPPAFASLHDKHVDNVGLTCPDCHDIDKLRPSHFVGLNTPAFEGIPAVTIRAGVTYAGSVASGSSSCSPTPRPGGFPICHATRPWAGP